MKQISRREFIKTTAVGLGSLATLDVLPRKVMAFEAADVLLLNGNIITIDAKDTIAQAVAIRNGRVLKVGSNQEVQSWSGNGTERIDLKGKNGNSGIGGFSFAYNGIRHAISSSVFEHTVSINAKQSGFAEFGG